MNERNSFHQKHGYWTESNGDLYRSGHYKNGEMDGLWRFRKYEDIVETMFLNGNRHGIEKRMKYGKLVGKVNYYLDKQLYKIDYYYSRNNKVHLKFYIKDNKERHMEEYYD